MTLYGIKAVKLIVEPIEERCVHCDTVHTMDMHIFQKYISLMGIPVFPVGKTGISFCNHCKQITRRKDMRGSLKKVFEKVRSHAHIPFWTWVGTVLAMLALVLTFFYNWQ